MTLTKTIQLKPDMSILIHLIKTPTGFEFSVPTPKNKGGLPRLVIPGSDKYVASFMLPCGFDKAMEVVEALTHDAPKDGDYIAWILETMQDFRHEIGKRGFGS